MSAPDNNKQPRTREAEDSSFKDKRLLVLFLFGLFLVGCDVWPFRFSPEATRLIFYSQSDQLADSGQVKLVAISPEQRQAQQKRHSNTPSGIEGEITPLFNTLSTSSNVPVEFDLFLNRPLRLNSASQLTLTMLPGVGPHLASAIVATRNKQGAFTGPQDLLQVPGIGAARLQQLQPLVSFE